MATSAALLNERDLSEGIYEVYAMRFATNRSQTVHGNFIVRDMHDGPMPLDYNVWIVRNACRTVLVDTGFGAEAAMRRNRLRDFDPLEGLARIGIDPSEIEDVVLTHLHYDHAGNIGRFAKARFHVQDAEMAFATGRCMCDTHVRHPFDEEDVVALVRNVFRGRTCFHHGDAIIFPGISLHLLPGHSQGMQAVRVVTPRGPIVLASDVTHFYSNLLRRSPFAWTNNVLETMSSYSKLLEISGGIERIIPGHDPRIRELYPSYPVNGVELTSLHERPNVHDASQLARVDNYEIEQNIVVDERALGTSM